MGEEGGVRRRRGTGLLRVPSSQPPAAAATCRGPWWSRVAARSPSTRCAPPTPQLNIPAWVFCMSWRAELEFRVTHKLGAHRAGSLLPASVTVLESSVSGGRRVVRVVRPLASGPAFDYSSLLAQAELPLITAVGAGPKFAYHKSKSVATASVRRRHPTAATAAAPAAAPARQPPLLVVCTGGCARETAHESAVV